MSHETISVPSALRVKNDDGGRTPSTSVLTWRIAAIVSVAVVIAIHIYVAASANAPRTPWDENHLLQMARLISGDDNVPGLHGAGYYPGWAFMMAPIWWFTQDPVTVYSAAITLGNVIAVATIIPLAMVAKRLGLTTPQAITAGALVMCLPGRTVNAEYALSEKPLMFFLAWILVAVIAFWRKPTWLNAVLLAAAATATYFIHTRALAIVLVVAIWFVLFMVLRRRLWAPLIGLAALGAGALAVRAVASALLERVLLGQFAQGEFFTASLSRSSPGSISRVLLGQVWAQFVGTAGLFVLGLVVLIIWSWREVRKGKVGVGSFILGLTIATIATSVLSWAGTNHLNPLPTARFDANVYTRYIDPIATLVCLIAIVALIRRVTAPVIAAALAVAVAVCLPVVYWVGLTAPLWGSLDGPANSAAILSWDFMFGTGHPFTTPLVPTLFNENRFWLLASLFVILCVSAMFLLRLTPRLLVAAGLILGSALSYTADPDLFRDYPKDLTASVEQIEALEPGDELLTLNIDRECRGPAITYGQVINWLPYWLTPRTVDMIDVAHGQEFTSDVVVSCGNWPRAEEFGALRLEGADDYTYRIWILPGERQDRLEDEGLLEEVPTEG